MQDDLQQAITSHPDGVTIRVYVAPRSSANGVIGLHNGELKITLTAPPVDGAANRALLEFLAKVLGASKSDVSLASGESSRHKVVRLNRISASDVMERLGQTAK